MVCQSLITRRAEGDLRPSALETSVHTRRLMHAALSTRIEVKSSQQGPINQIDLDPCDERYLLVASGDATVGLYDMEVEPAQDGCESDGQDGSMPSRVQSLHVTPRTRAHVTENIGDLTGGRVSSSIGNAALAARMQPPSGGHRYSVTSVQWYPPDTGIFVSGSTDGSVQVWDTNLFVSAGTFSLGSKVHAVAMSRAMLSRSLIAVGTDDRRVRLCDLKSGGSSHLLAGHAQTVTTVAWSPTEEHLLATGSRDSTVRLWDVRRSGASACLKTLDQDADHRGRATGILSAPTALAKAHAGWVVSLDFTPNGCWLVSAGTDKRLRLWNAMSGQNTLLNYAGTHNDIAVGWKIKAIQTAGRRGVGRDWGEGNMILYPNGRSGEVLLFPLLSRGGMSGRSRSQSSGRLERPRAVGQPSHRLRGHLDVVQSMAYRRDAGQIITGGADSLLLVFDCSRHDKEESRLLDGENDGQYPKGSKRRAAEAADQWSSDEDDNSGRVDHEEGFVPPILRQYDGDNSHRSTSRRREH